MKKKVFTEKNTCSVQLSFCSHTVFNAAKFSIKRFIFIYFTVFFVSQRDKYEIVTETHPFKNT